jgi:hypothetical protein
MRRLVLLAVVVTVISTLSLGQTATTGALTGLITDPSGAIVVGAQVKVTNEATGETRTVTSRADGMYVVPLLPPGKYGIEISQKGFKTASVSGRSVAVTETSTANVKLEVGAATETIEVTATGAGVNTESAELGTVTGREMIANLPLVTRNYTQIIGLNPGISAEPTNAGELGKGSSSYGASSGGFSAQGGATNDNNFQMNGISVNDTFGSAQYSGGIAVPNPDTLEEFKVLTGQYDASYGRNSGANVNVVTRGGSNAMHGSVFEYFRNDAMNANLFFNNRLGVPRPVLKNNQFGFTLGGPIKKNKLLYFGSYQGTRQRNGLASGCIATMNLPPLTNDRSAAALGAIFGGQVGYFNYALGVTSGVPVVAANGSNINPVALKILQAKWPNGDYVIPTPQRTVAYTPPANPSQVDPSLVDGLASSTWSVPCPYTEDQYMGNVDYLQSDKSTWRGRFFAANSTANQSLAAGIPGFGLVTLANYRNFSLHNTYIFDPSLLNQVTIGYTRQLGGQVASNPFQLSDFGMTGLGSGVPPVIYLNGVNTGLNLGGKGQSLVMVQNTYTAEDALSWTHGKHNFRFGGGLNRWQANLPGLKYPPTVQFLTLTDMMLGNDAATAGMAAYGYGNVYGSIDLLGNLTRYYRVGEANAYVQDDIKVARSLTLNVGFRFERLGGMSDKYGNNTSFDLSLANPTPPAGGTLAGWVVPFNFKGTVPAGVTRTGNNLGISGQGQNTANPRVGFAWQLPKTSRLVLRGGWGMFHSRTTGVGLFQSLSAPPLTYTIVNVGPANAAATAANPFPGGAPTLPIFPIITPSTAVTPQVLSQSYRPPSYQHYSMGLQTAITKDLTLDVSYVGGRGTHLMRWRMANQPGWASASNPIRGVTTDTTSKSNIIARLPYQGLSYTNTYLFENGGAAWYNSLQVRATKRFSQGLTFQAAYTFARDLTDVPGEVSATIGGRAIGDQNNPKAQYGPDPFIREHRFVLSYLYALPGPKNLSSIAGHILGNWSIAGVTTAQSGHRLTIGYTNAQNVFGNTSDRPDYTPGCNIASSGSTEQRLSSWWNGSCFTKPALLAAPNSGTLFGNSPIGLGHGPRQVNFDLSIVKKVPVKWPNEHANVEFYTQMFNALNHPQFSDPRSTWTGTGTSGFGSQASIQSTIGNPRIVQLALRFSF